MVHIMENATLRGEHHVMHVRSYGGLLRKAARRPAENHGVAAVAANHIVVL
jgi:hypothetical protein